MTWDGFMMNCVIGVDIVFVVTLLSMAVGASLIPTIKAMSKEDVPTICFLALLILCIVGMFSINFFLLSQGS